MGRIEELERKAVQHPKAIATEDLDTIARHSWGIAGSCEPRDRAKVLKKAAHYAVWAFRKGVKSPEILSDYMQLLAEAIRFHPSPEELSAARSRIVASWLKLTGNDRVVLLHEASGSIDIETGWIAVADPSQLPPFEDPSDRALVAHMNQGKALYFSTAGDGAYDVRLRVIEAREPVLRLAEYKRVAGSTETVVLSVRSGNIILVDPSAIGEPGDGVALAVAPGNYKVCVYGYVIPERFAGYVAVLCATAEPAVNRLDRCDCVQV